MNIPSPFARRRRKGEQPEPEVMLDMQIPFGVHPLIDYIRFTLLLLQNQREMADLVGQLHRRIVWIRRSMTVLVIASGLASLMQAAQLWLNWK